MFLDACIPCSVNPGPEDDGDGPNSEVGGTAWSWDNAHEGHLTFANSESVKLSLDL